MSNRRATDSPLSRAGRGLVPRRLDRPAPRWWRYAASAGAAHSEAESAPRSSDHARRRREWWEQLRVGREGGRIRVDEHVLPLALITVEAQLDAHERTREPEQRGLAPWRPDRPRRPIQPAVGAVREVLGLRT